MADKTIRIKRGNKANMPTATPAKDGELLWAKDTEELYINSNGNNVLINSSGGSGDDTQLRNKDVISATGDTTLINNTEPLITKDYADTHYTGDGNPYVLPQATETALGGVKAAAKTASDSTEIRIGTDGKLYVAVGSGPGGEVHFADIEGEPWDNAELADAIYHRQAKLIAGSGVKLQGQPDGTQLISFDGSTVAITGDMIAPLLSSTSDALVIDYDEGSGIINFTASGGSGPAYVLPIASVSAIGGVKGPAKTAAQTQPVTIDATGNMYVLPNNSATIDGHSILAVTEDSDTVTASVDEDGNISYHAVGGGSGTTNYNDLTNKPKIKGIELTGSVTSDQLKLQDSLTNSDGTVILTPNGDGTTSISATGGGSGGATSYNTLTDKPSINGHMLTGNQTAANLGLQIPVVGGNDISVSPDGLISYTGNETVSFDEIEGQPSDNVALANILGNKQNKLIAGTNVTFNGDTINVIAPAPSADSLLPVLEAGANIQLTNDAGRIKIDASSGAGATASWGNISGTISSQNDLTAELNKKLDIKADQGNVYTTDGLIQYEVRPGGWIPSYDATGKLTTASINIGSPADNDKAVNGYTLYTNLSIKENQLIAGSNVSLDKSNPNSTLISVDIPDASVSFDKITGHPADNTELNTALNAKQNTLSTAQLAAVNSGITNAKVNTYDGYNALISQNTSDIAATKASLDNKVDKKTTAWTLAVYCTGPEGGTYNERLVQGSSTNAANSIMFRDSAGRTSLADPTADAHAATKKYVDDAVANSAGASPNWGDIAGTLANQVDLKTELDSKFAIPATGTYRVPCINGTAGTPGTITFNNGTGASTLAQRTTTGTLRGATAVADTDLVPLAQMNNAIASAQGADYTAGPNIAISTDNVISGTNASAQNVTLTDDAASGTIVPITSGTILSKLNGIRANIKSLFASITSINTALDDKAKIILTTAQLNGVAGVWSHSSIELEKVDFINGNTALTAWVTVNASIHCTGAQATGQHLNVITGIPEAFRPQSQRLSVGGIYYSDTLTGNQFMNMEITPNGNVNVDLSSAMTQEFEARFSFTYKIGG